MRYCITCKSVLDESNNSGVDVCCKNCRHNRYLSHNKDRKRRRPSKACYRCKEVLTEDNSSASSRFKCGACRNCSVVVSRESRKRNPISFLLRGSRCSAKRRGREHSINVEDLVIPEFCPVFPWVKIDPQALRSFNSPSIDRIDNLKGYVKGNVRIISFRANSMKSNMTDVEMLALGKDARKRKKTFDLSQDLVDTDLDARRTEEDILNRY